MSSVYIKGESLKPGIVLLSGFDVEYEVVEVKPFITFLSTKFVNNESETDYNFSIVIFDTLMNGKIERVIEKNRMYKVKGSIETRTR